MNLALMVIYKLSFVVYNLIIISIYFLDDLQETPPMLFST